MNDEGVIIDCGRCVLRGISCSDCVIGVLVDVPRPVEWDEAELRAVETLAEAGLVPKLRFAPAWMARGDRAA
ncbi:hypothetical protein [Amycolatopsis taiwanensis]|uniref:Uncharacterized protein n=1 Tax=Amycolatopsis taiwanensis TaxID=342230 RepID=A0A9W6R0G5_9PSEU|nr:hypothetical protein [Amycolatopsis taiwanensis]GLY66180.1 hypothetical protein Atai01_27990 [Amycolatopsis taiwanensis]